MKRLFCLFSILGLLSLGMTGCTHGSSFSTSQISQSPDQVDPEPSQESDTPSLDSQSSASENPTQSSSVETSNGQIPSGESDSSSVGGGTATSAHGSGTASSAKPATTSKPATTTTGSNATNSEMRGVWVSYMELNTMFKGKTTVQAKSMIDAVMDNAKSYGLNTVIFQVRPKSDAYYKSTVYKAAASVQPLIAAGFDPLQYAVTAAHSRGLKLQAWVNPYRIGTDSSYAACTDYFSVSDTYYYDPASLAVQALILKGIKELVNNYAIDGVQFDDYFYPTNTTAIPPSSPAAFEKSEYGAYQSGGGKLGIAEWRRATVSALVASVYSRVHARSGCVFGISPSADFNKDYSVYYADVRTWIAGKTYIDYICPQIYYGFENSNLSFSHTLTSWISLKRSSSVSLYVGLALYKTGWAKDAYAGTGTTEWAEHSDIMKRSVLLLRSEKACSGMMFFSYGAFNSNSSTARDSQTYSAEVATNEIKNLLSVLCPQSS